jgi:predicted nuclease with TOPRIM domain
MSEISKQEILLNDLSEIQSQVEILTNKCKNLTDVIKELEKQINILKKEKLELSKNISELEAKKEKPGLAIFNSLGEEDKEELKNNISTLISRIDFHLSNDRQL